MPFIVKGTARCRNIKGKGMVAYIPIEMNRNDCYLTLSQQDKPKEHEGHFMLTDKKWEDIASCDFRENHAYMAVYKELRQVLERGLAQEKEIPSNSLETAKKNEKQSLKYKPAKVQEPVDKTL